MSNIFKVAPGVIHSLHETLRAAVAAAVEMGFHLGCISVLARNSEASRHARFREANPKSRAPSRFAFARNGGKTKSMRCVWCGACGPTWGAQWPKTKTAEGWEESHECGAYLAPTRLRKGWDIVDLRARLALSVLVTGEAMIPGYYMLTRHRNGDVSYHWAPRHAKDRNSVYVGLGTPAGALRGMAQALPEATDAAARAEVQLARIAPRMRAQIRPFDPSSFGW